MSEFRYVNPPNVGWLQIRLDSNVIDYVWERIRNCSSPSWKHKLAGDVHESKLLEDPDDWFYNNVIQKSGETYQQLYYNLGLNLPIPEGNYSYYMKEWWVNYQHQGEFNPIHHHTGVYSFVIWLKIPVEHEEQNKDNTSNMKLRSAFQFTYTDILGSLKDYTYQLDKSWEGTMLFFPSELHHQVYPFYNCDEDRITVSGNVLCKV